MSAYKDIEDAIIERLQPFKTIGFDVVAMPELQGDYQKTIVTPRITVGFFGSDFGGFESTAGSSQWETIRMIVSIQTRRLRGVADAYELIALLRRYLIGLPIAGFDPLKIHELAVKDTDFTANIWTFYGLFSTRRRAIQDFEEAIVPNFEVIQFDNEIL